MQTKHKSWRLYVGIWLALVCLTGLSWFASTLHIGAADTVVALAIASVKTTLVLLFFMHLIEEKFTNAMAPIVAVLFVILLCSLTAADVATRRTFPRAPVPFRAAPAVQAPAPR